MDFKKGSEYTRNEIHSLYFGVPVPMVGTGNWTTGYVRPNETDDLIAFMNINVPGTTGHNFPNEYNPVEKTITWYGKPGSHSEQPTFQKLKKRELTPHFFARWNTSDPFVYLGVGKILKYEDGHPAKKKDGTPSTCIQVTLSCDDTDQILPGMNSGDKSDATFAMEKHLEDFIIENWDSLDIGNNYDKHEEEKDGKRKKYRTDTGEIDIFARSKDKTHYLVIELKKGRANDKVVGQIQRYMGYIKDEICKDNQRVKGLIIGLKDDLGLRRAISINPDIEFRRYQIRFDLIKDEV